MAIHIKAEKSYYVTEVSIDLPAKVEDVDALLRELKTNGKMVVVYNGGSVQGHSFEQRTHIPEAVDAQIRNLLKLGTKKISAASRKI
jgi:hypothetical protein